jgi:hypothetical protein
MFVSCECLCYQVEVSATGRSLVQRSPTDCGVFECDQVKTKTLYTYCEQVGSRGKDCETFWCNVTCCSQSMKSRLSSITCSAQYDCAEGSHLIFSLMKSTHAHLTQHHLLFTPTCFGETPPSSWCLYTNT